MKQAQEIVGYNAVIIGLHGDPVSKEPGAPTLAQVGSDVLRFYSGSEADKYLFWSRVLICRILGGESRRSDSIELVLKPRSLWLYIDPNDPTKFIDYSGDETLISDPSDTADEEPTTNEISIIHNEYRIGQIIQVARLNVPMRFRDDSLNGWGDITYPGLSYIDDIQGVDYPSERYVNNGVIVEVNGIRHPWYLRSSTYMETFGGRFYPETINYFDLNVDGRKRGGVGGTISGDRIIIPVCKGGVMKNYSFVGEEVV